MSETPETDSFTHSTDETPLDAWVYAGHAMRLERERDEARMELAHIEEYGTKEINEAVTLRQELAKALLERDEARRQASVWEKLALREASINGARLCGKEEAKWGWVLPNGCFVKEEAK